MLIRNLIVLAVLAVSLQCAELPEPILLWPYGAPGSENKTDAELVVKSQSGEESIYRVHKPSILPYLPAKEKANGTAVIVIPGGGHRVLAITHEGSNLGEWFRERGIAAFVLKYRLARETNSTYSIKEHAVADTQRAIRLVRSRAWEWNINPDKIGVIGFSAGGELAAICSTEFDPGNSEAKDPVEKQSSRPNFQGLIYPGRSGDIQPTAQTAPAFLACAYDDRPDISQGLAEVYLRYKQVKVPAELHIYSKGGHGFGVRPNRKFAAAQWTDRFLEWMRDNNFTP